MVELILNLVHQVYFIKLLCFHLCFVNNLDIYCKTRACRENQIYEVLKCRFLSNPLFKNVRYRLQMTCLFENTMKIIKNRPELVYFIINRYLDMKNVTLFNNISF